MTFLSALQVFIQLPKDYKEIFCGNQKNTIKQSSMYISIHFIDFVRLLSFTSMALYIISASNSFNIGAIMLESWYIEKMYTRYIACRRLFLILLTQ